MSSAPKEVTDRIASAWEPKPTLPGAAYHRPQVWEEEKERIFAAEWTCVGREEEIPEHADYLVREVVDGSRGRRFDRSTRPLWGIAVETWGGFIFVNLGREPGPLHGSFARNPEGNPMEWMGRWGMSEFLFHPDAIARDDFDLSDIVGFWDLVSRQDWAVCERAQTGVSSRAYANGGVYPFNDRWLAEFADRYRRSMSWG